MTAPGDMKNNLKILQGEIRYIKYPSEIDLQGITRGNPQAFLPLYHHAFNNYSPAFTAEVMKLLEDSLYSKSDMRFMEGVYKILRDLFNYKPHITKDQFFANSGFAERKVMMCADVLRLIRERARRLAPPKDTNPNIRASAVIDNRRTSKVGLKHSTENLVIQEPAIDQPVSRKVSTRPHTAPHSVSDHSKASSAEDKTATRSCSASESASGKSPESPRVISVVAQTPEHSITEPPSPRMDAMVTILSKVRDIPAQLSTFMQAVETRLEKMEGRLDALEERAQKNTMTVTDEMGHTTQEELYQQLETLRSRVVLLENRVTLTETKVTRLRKSTLTQGTHSDQRELKCATAPDAALPATGSPFVTVERGGSLLQDPQKDLGDDSFAASLVKNFSPIRREGLVFGNDTFQSISDYNPRRASTPTHPQENGASDENSANRVASSSSLEAGKAADPAITDLSSTFQAHNLDASTQNQVERIKGMLQETRQHLVTSSPPETVGSV